MVVGLADEDAANVELSRSDKVVFYGFERLGEHKVVPYDEMVLGLVELVQVGGLGQTLYDLDAFGFAFQVIVEGFCSHFGYDSDRGEGP